jgi:hypothetical protein
MAARFQRGHLRILLLDARSKLTALDCIVRGGIKDTLMTELKKLLAAASVVALLGVAACGQAPTADSAASEAAAVASDAASAADVAVDAASDAAGAASEAASGAVEAASGAAEAASAATDAASAAQ